MKLYLYEYCDAQKRRSSASICIADTKASSIVNAIVEDIYGDVVYFDGYKEANTELKALMSVLGISDLSQTNNVVFNNEMVYRLNTGLDYAILREIETGVRQD